MKNEIKNSAAWHAASKESVLSALGVKPESGLNGKEVRARRRRYGINRIYSEEKASVAGYLGYCFSDLMLILLLITASVAAVFGEEEMASVIIPILIVSIVFRTFAYIRARRYLEAASAASAVMPSVSVLREGKILRIDARSIVPGDILRFSVGDIVPCDCRIISSSELAVYEENITGNRGVTHKTELEVMPDTPPSACTDMLYAGSSVFSGRAVAAAVATGADTFAVRTKGELTLIRGGELKITRLLERYSRVWSAVMTLIVFVITGLNLIFSQRGLYDVFFMGLALAVASMCEYYSALGDIAAAAGLSALAIGNGTALRENGVSVRGVRSIEALSELDAVIFPMEGVLVTDGIMCRYAVLRDGKLVDSINTEESPELFRCAMVSTGLYGNAVQTGNAASEKSPERGESACLIRDYVNKNFISDEGVYKENEAPVVFAGVADGLPFDAQLIYNSEGYVAYLSGNAKSIMETSISILDENGTVSALGNELKASLLRAVSYHERRGATVIAVAKKETPFHSRERMNFVMTDVTLVGIMAFYRPLAPDVEGAVTAARESGIRLIMTGNGKSSVLTAQRAGIVNSRNDVIMAKEFSLLDPEAKRAAAESKSLLIGFDAKNLAVFIDILQKQKKKIAYVADSGHDMISEIKILHGVGASFAVSHENIRYENSSEKIVYESDGVSQTLKMNADNIIPRANSNGGGLPSVIECVSFAKKICENVASIASYLVTSQAARMLMVLYSVVFHGSALGAEQILVWGLILDFFAVIIIALERPDYKTLRRRSDIYERLSNPFSGISVSLAYGIFWGALTMLTVNLFCGNAENASTVIFISVILSIIAVCGEHRSEYSVFSKYRSINVSTCLFIGMSLLIIILCTVSEKAASAMGVTSPDPVSLIISTVPAILIFMLYEFERFLSIKRKKNQI